MTPDDIRRDLAALRLAGEQCRQEWARLRQRLDAWLDDDSHGTLGVRQPLTPRGPAPRTTSTAVRIEA